MYLTSCCTVLLEKIIALWKATNKSLKILTQRTQNTFSSVCHKINDPYGDTERVTPSSKKLLPKLRYGTEFLNRKSVVVNY